MRGGQEGTKGYESGREWMRVDKRGRGGGEELGRRLGGDVAREGKWEKRLTKKWMFDR